MGLEHISSESSSVSADINAASPETLQEDLDNHESPPVTVSGELGGREAIATGPEGFLQALVLKGELNDLRFDQKRLLAAFIEFGVTQQAYDFTGLAKSRHNYWIRTNPTYAEAVNALGKGLLLEAKARLDSLYPKAAEALDDALDAEKRLKVTCPCGCVDEQGKPFSFYVDVADMKLRVDVAKSIFNRSGDFGAKGTVTVKHEGEVASVVMSLEERIALQQISRGMPVPADVVMNLRSRGLLPPAGNVIEGEYRESATAPSPPGSP